MFDISDARYLSKWRPVADRCWASVAQAEIGLSYGRKHRDTLDYRKQVSDRSLVGASFSPDDMSKGLGIFNAVIKGDAQAVAAWLDKGGGVDAR